MYKPIATTTQGPAVTRSRNEVLKEIREQLGPKTPQTLRLIDALIAACDTLDLLTEVFSAEQAQTYIQAGFEEGEMGNNDHA